MIVPDINLLLYAYNSSSPFHGKAAAWWRGRMTGTEPVLFLFAVLLGFMRIATNPAGVYGPHDNVEGRGGRLRALLACQADRSSSGPRPAAHRRCGLSPGRAWHRRQPGHRCPDRDRREGLRSHRAQQRFLDFARFEGLHASIRFFPRRRQKEEYKPEGPG